MREKSIRTRGKFTNAEIGAKVGKAWLFLGSAKQMPRRLRQQEEPLLTIREARNRFEEKINPDTGKKYTNAEIGAKAGKRHGPFLASAADAAQAALNEEPLLTIREARNRFEEKINPDTGKNTRMQKSVLRLGKRHGPFLDSAADAAQAALNPEEPL